MSKTRARAADVVSGLIAVPGFVAPFFFGLFPCVYATFRLPEAGRIAVRA